MLVSVMNEVLEEVQQMNKTLKQVDSRLKDLEARVQIFHEKKIELDLADLGPVMDYVGGIVMAVNEYTRTAGNTILQQLKQECEGMRQMTAVWMDKVTNAVEARPKRWLF